MSEPELNYYPGQTQDRISQMFVRQAPAVAPEETTTVTPAPRSSWTFGLVAVASALFVVGLVGVGMSIAEAYLHH